MKDDSSNKKLIIGICAVFVVFLVLIGLFVHSIDQKHEDDGASDATKLFGLLSAEDPNKLPVIKKEDMEAEIASRPPITEAIAQQIKTHVSQYLVPGQFKQIDSYLIDMEYKYRGSDDPNGMSLDDIKYMRADISMIREMNPLNAETMMQSFHNPEFLMAAMVYEPISTKYHGLMNGASLVLPPPGEDEVIVWDKKEMTPELKSSILNQVNQRTNGMFNDVLVYTMNQLGVEFEYILGHSIISDSWCAYLIQTQDSRAYKMISSASDLKIQVRDGIMEEKNMDGCIIYFNIDDMDIESSSQDSGDFVNTNSGKALIDTSEEGISKNSVQIDDTDEMDYDPREVGKPAMPLETPAPDKIPGPEDVVQPPADGGTFIPGPHDILPQPQDPVLNGPNAEAEVIEAEEPVVSEVPTENFEVVE